MAFSSFSLDRIREQIFFQSLDDQEWQELTKLLIPQRFFPAQVLFAEGDSSKDLYIVLGGIVELRRQFVRHPGDYLLATLHAGQVLGEQALLTGHRRSSTAVALADVDAATLSAKNLGSLPLSAQVKLYRAYAELLSERFYWLDQMFTDLLEQRGAESTVSTMALLQQRYQPQ